MGNIATSDKDELLVSWVQSRVVYNLLNNPWNLFDGKIFYPHENTLAFSDLQIVSAVLAAPVFFLTKQPISFINFTFLISLLLVSSAVFFITKKITGDNPISFTCGVLLMFSPAFLGNNVHVQVLAVYCCLFSAFFLIKYLESKKNKFFIFSLVFFTLQAINSFLPGYFNLFINFSLVFFFILAKKISVIRLFKKKHIFFIFLSLSVIAVFAIPYYKTSIKYNFVRDIREVIHLSMSPEDYYWPNDLTRIYPLLNYFSRPELYKEGVSFKPGYPGVVFAMLSVLAIVYFLKYFKKLPYHVRGFFISGLFGFILSFGPVMHIGRKVIHDPFPLVLPYTAFYYLFPGFKGIRAAYRFEVLFLICFSVCIGYFLYVSLKNMNKSKKNIILLVLIFFTVAEFNFPMRFKNIIQTSNIPEVYKHMKSFDEKKVFIEMPIYNWNVKPYSDIEFYRLYYQSYHNNILVNGTSGFSPAPWQDFSIRTLKTFPEETSITELKKMKVDYIVFHKSEYDKLYKDQLAIQDKKIKSGNEILKILLKKNILVLDKRFDEDYLFKIL